MAKSKSLIQDFQQEIKNITVYLVEQGLVDVQSFATRRDRGEGIVALEADYWSTSPRLQEHIDYSELYFRAIQSQFFDLKFLDGALVQFRYEFFSSGELRRARIAFLPAPDLTPFQEQPELYLLDELYGDVVDRRTVTVPLRFDFDSRPDVAVDLHHPVSHLTLGQYPHCRIAVSGAVTPYYFIEFILRSFYRTRSSLLSDQLPGPKARLARSITRLEETFMHVNLPGGV